MATKQKDGSSQPSRSRKAPKKSASKSASRSATKKEPALPSVRSPRQWPAPGPQRSPRLFPQSPVVRRIAHGSTLDPGTSRSRSTTQARSASRSQGSMLNPMAWLSSLETTLTSPQARAVMAEALRAVANVLEKPQGSEQGQGGGTQQGRNAVSAAGSLGAEIVAAPLEVAAAAIGAAGEVVTSALGGSSGGDRGNGESSKGRRRSSSRKKSSAGD